MIWSAPIVFYAHGFADNQPRVYADEELVDALREFMPPGCDARPDAATPCPGRTCPAKSNVPCWSPVTLAPGTTRAGKNVVSVNYAVFDLDHLKTGQLEALLAALGDEYEYVVHSTHSHAPAPALIADDPDAPGDECYRIIFPLTRPATPTEWPIVRRIIVEALGLPADPACGDLSRLYALPTQRAGIAPYASHRRGKATLDVDEALAVAKAAPPAPPAPVSYDLGELRAHIIELKRAKAKGDQKAKAQAIALDAVLEGRPLAEPGSRDNTLLSTIGMLAYKLPDVPWSIVLELLRPSLHAMDTAPEGLDHWIAKCQSMYDRALAAKTARKLQREADDQRFAEIQAKVAARRKAEHTDDDDDADPYEGWENLLIENKSGVKGCEYNAEILLTCAPETREAIRFNVITKTIEVTHGKLAGLNQASLAFAATSWLQAQYKFQGGVKLVGAALLHVAQSNPYEPIADMLNALEWDGTTRIDTFLETYAGAVGDVGYLRTISRKWLIGLVARALRPGCKMDNVLILEGAQGVGKSTALEALVGREYFLDTALALGNKDTIQAIAGAWIVELGELASVRRAEHDRTKQFITAATDKYRPPYGAVTEISPRRCVFVGTTNDSDYLYDPTGNRRYWPITTTAVDVEAVRRDRLQIFAEAVAAYRAGEIWWLTPKEAATAIDEAEDRVGSSPIEEAIARWWYAETPAKRLKHFTMLQVMEDCLKMTTERIDNRAVRTEVGVSLRRIGFKCVRKRTGGRLQRVYEATQELIDAPVVARPTTGLTLVQAIKDKGVTS